MEEEKSSELPTYSHTWVIHFTRNPLSHNKTTDLFLFFQTSTQRFDLAALCVYVVTNSSWSNNDAEKAWKQSFLSSVFRHLAIDDKKGIIITYYHK